MAQVALTDEQKEILSKNERYSTLTKWAMIDKARYWAQLDGSSVPGNDRIKWAKSRTFAVNNIRRDNNLGSTYKDPFLALTTQAVVDDSGPFDADKVIDYMISTSVFESVADLVFDEKIKEILF